MRATCILLLLGLVTGCQFTPSPQTWRGTALIDQKWPHRYLLTRKGGDWIVTPEQQFPGSHDWVPLWGPAKVEMSGERFVEFTADWGVPGKALPLGFRLEFPPSMGDTFEALLFDKSSSKPIRIVFSKIRKPTPNQAL
jgi:hypothetical protein